MASEFSRSLICYLPFLKKCWRVVNFSRVSMMSIQITRFRVFRVKLAVNRDTQEAIAVKIIDLEKAAEKDCYDNVRKEVGDTIYLNDNLPLLNSNFEIDTDRGFCVIH